MKVNAGRWKIAELPTARLPGAVVGAVWLRLAARCFWIGGGCCGAVVAWPWPLTDDYGRLSTNRTKDGRQRKIEGAGPTLQLGVRDKLEKGFPTHSAALLGTLHLAARSCFSCSG